MAGDDKPQGFIAAKKKEKVGEKQHKKKRSLLGKRLKTKAPKKLTSEPLWL